ncbi:hypothetical protein DFH11DRAFT_1726277 [Phellopilus nigrolimitatus]|nr:hypothetical protein DFH11DRAFT_1726277 [Phellopilus nigrolimitatus]
MAIMILWTVSSGAPGGISPADYLVDIFAQLAFVSCIMKLNQAGLALFVFGQLPKTAAHCTASAHVRRNPAVPDADRGTARSSWHTAFPAPVSPTSRKTRNEIGRARALCGFSSAMTGEYCAGGRSKISGTALTLV